MSGPAQDWDGAWRRAAAALDHPLLERPHEHAATAFAALAQLRPLRQAVADGEIELDAFAADCVALVAPMPRGGAGFVKSVYFTTRGTQLMRLLYGLLLLAATARLHGYEGPLAWISFPVSLLEHGQEAQIRALLAQIETLPAPLARAVSVVFDDGRPAPEGAPLIHIGTGYPYRLAPLHQQVDAYEVHHGLPLICVPSRAASSLTLTISPCPGGIA